MNRKMVLSKAAQVASAECRQQFARARAFLQTLHEKRQAELYREYKAGLFFQQLSHSLEDKDSRERALEEQISHRVYQKKLVHSTEFHMAQNLEEAQYLDHILGLLDDVQQGKEDAAREIMQQQIRNLKAAAGKAREREEELQLFYASAKLEMAKLVAENVEIDAGDGEDDLAKDQLVDRLDRRKDFNEHGTTLSMSDLYDEILWSVAASDLTLSVTNSNTYSDGSGDEYEGEYDEDGMNEQVQVTDERVDLDSHTNPVTPPSFFNRDDSSCGIDSATMDRGKAGHRSPVGRMQIRQLNRSMRAREKEILDRHRKDVRNEKKAHLEEMRALEEKWQNNINGILEKTITECHVQRESIKERMCDLRKKQEEAVEALRLSDLEMMHNALHDEDQRLADVKEASFADAQALISTQVFHEVRNALSSVVAMSEMTSSMKDDKTVPQETKDASIDDMLNQSTEVVSYALQTLNNVLDLSKLKSSTMKMKKSEFDVQDLVYRCTTMQKSKAVKATISFTRFPQSFVANSDSDISMRIMVNLISNAVKFTSCGGIQPFVWPVGEVRPRTTNSGHDDQAAADKEGSVRQIAVGVADTGSGLDPRYLEAAAKGVLSGGKNGGYNHGASNSGFGLHLCQLLAHSLGTKLQLSRLVDVEHLLNYDLKKEIELRRANIKESGASEDGSRFGTVLYFTLDVFGGETSVTTASSTCNQPVMSTLALGQASGHRYVFRPRPSPSSKCECFRVLLADDVLMLRKGLANALVSLFRECAVSISTACSAEDLLRATAAQPFDLVISDNLFRHDPTAVKKMTFKEEKRDSRACLTYDPQTSSRAHARSMMTEFFRNERFSMREGDGEMLGVDALIQLSQTRHGNFPTPILMLLSGHKIEIPDDLGIIVAQKPLRQSELGSLLEANAKRLLTTENCSEISLNDDTSSRYSDSLGEESASLQSISCLVNRHGAQIFQQESIATSEPCSSVEISSSSE